MIGPIVVTGVPGAGKSTLAAALALALKLPLISLDEIKESMYDAADPDRGRLRLAAEAELCRRVTESANGAVVDIWLDPAREDRRRLICALSPVGSSCEVFCDVPSQVAVRRYRERSRHDMHLPLDEDVRLRIEQAVDDYAPDSPTAPAGLGPVLRVDTTEAVDVSVLAAEVASLR